MPLTLQRYNTEEAKSSIWTAFSFAASTFSLLDRHIVLIANRLVAIV